MNLHNDCQREIRWLPDSGADVDALSAQDFNRLGPDQQNHLAPDRQLVCAANGGELGSLGTLSATLTLNGRSCHTTLHIYPQLSTSLLSKATCIQLGLLEVGWPQSRLAKAAALSVEPPPQAGVSPPPMAVDPDVSALKNSIMADFPSVFQDAPLRSMAGPPMHITLRSDAVPCRHYRACAIPFQWRDAVEGQLSSMESKGVIKKVPVGEPFTWCHPMVVVPKKASAEPRITVDLTGLNKYVERPAYPTRVPSEIVASIPPGMRYFTTLDSRHGYWQIPLDAESSKLTTFITPWGAYRFRRNVMGLISAGDEHNRRGDEALAGLDNVQKVVEDVIIYDTDLDTHVHRVREVIRRCSEHGITLHPGKFVFGAPSATYCGFKVSADGYRVDDHLVKALRSFPVPTNRTDIRSFCGLVQQFQAFSPHLTEMLSPIRSLLSPKSAFVWEAPQQQAFSQVVRELTTPRILANYTPGLPLRLETDAAQSKGLGMALWQKQPSGEWRILQCGSRHVTPAESRYSATEVELLAVVWAVHKAHLYLAGADFELVVDHRPLIPILNSKTLDELPSPRLVHLKEKLALYRFTAVWRPGIDHKVVDCFSRYPVDDPDAVDEEADLQTPANTHAMLLQAHEDPTTGDQIHALLEDPRVARLKEEANRDPHYRQLREAIEHGFPADKRRIDDALGPFFAIRHDLWIADELVMYGSWVVIPATLRKDVLRQLHASHQGQDRTLRRARQVVYWPSITNGIRNVVRSCAECAERLPSHAPEPLLIDPPPSRPFERTAADLFQLGGKQFLVYTDRFSGWPTVGTCGRTATSLQVINLLKEWMADNGIPVQLTTDGGPQFTSQTFKQFCDGWGINHTVSSPHHHQANGAAEAAVKAVKTLLSKTTANGNINIDAFRAGLLEFRNTPRANGFSPSQLLFGLRSQVLAHPSAFKQEWRDLRNTIDQAASSLAAKAQQRHDQHAKPLPVLRHGTVVRVQHPRSKRWDTVAEVIEVKRSGRSYGVKTESGRMLWRNRRFLRLFYPTGI